MAQENERKSSLFLTSWGGACSLLLLLWPWFWCGEYTYNSSALRAVVLPLGAVIALFVIIPSKQGFMLSERWQALSIPGRNIILLLFLFFAWNLVSWYFAAEPAAARMGLIFSGRLTLITVVAALLASNPKISLGILRSLLLSSTIVGLVVVVIYFTGWQEAYYAPDRMDFPFSMPSALGGVSMLGALGVLALLSRRLVRQDNPPDKLDDSPSSKLLLPGLFLTLIFCLAGIILSGTRSCLIGLLAGSWLLGLVSLKKTRTLYLVATVVVFAICGYAILDILLTPAGKLWVYNASWGTRPLYINEALRLFWQRPLLGWGPGCFAYGVQLYESMELFLHSARGGWIAAAHCEPAQVLSQLGLPGMLLWLVIYAGAFAVCWRQRHTTCGLLLLIMLAGIFVDNLFSPAYHNAPDYSSLLALILGLAIACGSKAEAPRLESPPVQEKPPFTRMASFLLFRILLAVAALLVALTSLQAWYSQRLLAECVHSFNRGLMLMETGAAEESIKKVFADAEAQALAAMQNAIELDNWQRAAGFHIQAIDEQGDPSRLEEQLRLNWEILERLPALSNVFERIIELAELRGESHEQFFALLQALHRQPYSYSFRTRIRIFLRNLDEKTFSELRNWRDNMELTSSVEDSLAWLSKSDWQYLEAVFLYQHQQKEKALELMSGINAAEVKITPFSSEYGAMLSDAERFEEAKAVLEPLCEKIPADPVALFSLASTLLREAAGERMGIAAPVIPGNPRYLPAFLSAAASSEAGLEKCTRAYQFLQRALQRSRGLPGAALLSSQFDLLNSQPSQAIKTLQQALSIYSHNEQLHAALIQIFLHCGSGKEALRALATARQKCPNSIIIEELAATAE
ncbi:MAG: O-antigen ligase family protein [Planctomycetes bacterium]|nr:O-antigen ligase family protein [Planctomycetota bacterium]